MASIRTSIIAGFVLFAGIVGSVPAEAQLLTPGQLKAYEASKGQPRCAASIDKTQQMVKLLTVAALRSRAKAERNPIYWSDAGYYEAELAAAKKCVQSMAALKQAH